MRLLSSDCASCCRALVVSADMTSVVSSASGVDFRVWHCLYEVIDVEYEESG